MNLNKEFENYQLTALRAVSWKQKIYDFFFRVLSDARTIRPRATIN